MGWQSKVGMHMACISSAHTRAPYMVDNGGIMAPITLIGGGLRSYTSRLLKRDLNSRGPVLTGKSQ